MSERVGSRRFVRLGSYLKRPDLCRPKCERSERPHPDPVATGEPEGNYGRHRSGRFRGCVD